MDKKFSQFNVLTTFTGAEKIVGWHGADNIQFTIDNLKTHISDLITLTTVLTNSNSTDNIDITSPLGTSILTVEDSLSKLAYSISGKNGFVSFDYNGSILSFSDGVNSGTITQNETETNYAHTLKNTFSAPINEFGMMSIFPTYTDYADGYTLTFGGGNGFIQSNLGVFDFLSGFGSAQSSFKQDNASGVCYTEIKSYLGSGGNPSILKLDAINEISYLDSDDIINIGTTNANVINIGRAGATVNILGTALYEYAANQYVLDKCITLNYGGAVSSGIGVGLEIEENNVITGYLKTNSPRNGFSFLTPAIAYTADINLDLLSANRNYSLPDISGTIALLSQVTAMVTDTIVNGVTTIAPSQNAVYDALELKADKLIDTNRQTASYTLVLADANKLVEMNVASANNFTVPPNSSEAFPIKTQILGSQYGAGQTTIVAGAGVTIRSAGGFLKSSAQYAGWSLIKIGTDEWYLFGSLTA